MKNATINFGGGVKALGKGKVAGHLVLYGDDDSPDLSGEWFTAKTDYDVEFPAASAKYYHHGLDPKVKKAKLGVGTMSVEEEEVGIWIEGQLDLRDKYAGAVYKLAEDGKLGWSSGTAAHLVDKKATGEIVRWPLGLDASLTPTPCDPRNLASVKASALLSLPTLDELLGEKQATKSEGPSADDRRRILQKALYQKVLAERDDYSYPWVTDVFDASLVYEMGGKYFEAPYTMDGLAATVGEGVEVQQLTQYVASPATKTTFGGTTSEHARTAQAAVKGYLDRVREIRSRRGPEGGDVSARTLAELKGLHEEIGAFLREPTAGQLRAELNREKLKTMRPRVPLH